MPIPRASGPASNKGLIFQFGRFLKWSFKILCARYSTYHYPKFSDIIDENPLYVTMIKCDNYYSMDCFWNPTRLLNQRLRRCHVWKRTFIMSSRGCKMQIMFLVALKSALSGFQCQDFNFQMMWWLNWSSIGIAAR